MVQLYLRDMIGSVVRPIKELKAFDMVELEPGEARTITFTLSEKELGFFDNQGAFVIESGEFQILIGGSSNATLSGVFEIL